LSSSLSESLSSFFNSFFYVIISIIFLTLGFSFLSSYGYHKDRTKTGLISGIIGAVFVMLFFNASLVGIFLSIAIIITSVYIIPLSNTYGKEFKKWTRFRVGSNSLGKVFMIINVFVALGIFLSVSLNMGFYQGSFKENLATSLTTMTAVPQGFEDVVNQTTARQETEKFISQAIDNSPFFQIYLRWLPILLAFGVWVVLEFLRTFIFSNIGGIFTYALIRMNKN